MLISLAANYGWAVDHLDVVTAFLNPKIDCNNVYMSLPPGLDWLDSRFVNLVVVRLLKALSGLKQAPRLWYEEINAFLISIGLRQSPTDPNLYINPGILLLLYEDNIILAHTLPSGGESVKQKLLRKYRMSNLGAARRFLGIEITQETEGISLSQKEYIQRVLRRFRMESCHPALSPLDPNVRLNNPLGEDKQITDSRQYLSIVGSLMYAALGTRPDISYCVTALSRYNATPLQMHLTAARRALRYLKGTSSFKLHFSRGGGACGETFPVAVQGFTDSDWAGNELTRKSVGGCIFYTQPRDPEQAMIGARGLMVSGAVHWQSRTQSVVALSTPETEYIACSDAVREAIWVRRLLHLTWGVLA